MTRTLYLYLTRDLVKVMLTATAAFTLVMTVFGVIEPLRKEGLTGAQVLSLFGFTIVVMLSLTLPVAALFAATFVYGRFSQQRELQAARASGISAVSLLKPGLALGLLVTMISLLLSNYVTPVVAERGHRFATENIERIMYRRLQTKGTVETPDHRKIVHADVVLPEEKRVLGAVAAEIKGGGEVRLVAAREAWVRVEAEHGQNFATFHLTDAAAMRTSGHDITWIGEVTAPPQELDRPVKEKPAWYTWDELVAMRRELWRNPEVREELTRILQISCREALAKRILTAFRSADPEAKHFSLTDGRRVYDISAGFASHVKNLTIEIFSATHRGVFRRIRVIERVDGKITRTVHAHTGRILIDESEVILRPRISILLEGEQGVSIHTGLAEPDAPGAMRRREWSAGGLLLPPDIDARGRQALLRDIYQKTRQFTTSEGVILRLRRAARRMWGKIIAEMHSRVAYSGSCFLLVAMGAALGLIFRGGQVLSAFTISVLPAAMVIVLLAMGQELLTNPDIESSAGGLATIWSGLGLLLLGNLYLYWRLVRR